MCIEKLLDEYKLDTFLGLHFCLCSMVLLSGRHFVATSENKHDIYMYMETLEIPAKRSPLCIQLDDRYHCLASDTKMVKVSGCLEMVQAG